MDATTSVHLHAMSQASRIACRGAPKPSDQIHAIVSILALQMQEGNKDFHMWILNLSLLTALLLTTQYM